MKFFFEFNKWAGQNKWAGWKFSWILINEQGSSSSQKRPLFITLEVEGYSENLQLITQNWNFSIYTEYYVEFYAEWSAEYYRISCKVYFQISIWKLLNLLAFFHLTLGQAQENFNKWAGRNKWAGGNFFQKLINEQVPNKVSREGKSRKK